MIRRPPRSTQSRSSAASDVYKRQTDSSTCSSVAGLEDKLICAPGGAEAGYYVDAAGTPTACAADTYSIAGEDSTTACDACAVNENSDGTTACAACTSQTGCSTDGSTCSSVAGLEDKLICAPGGAEAGYYVDTAGTSARLCAPGTWSATGQSWVSGCAACTSQTGCSTDGSTCSSVAGLEDKLICAPLSLIHI